MACLSGTVQQNITEDCQLFITSDKSSEFDAYMMNPWQCIVFMPTVIL